MIGAAFLLSVVAAVAPPADLAPFGPFVGSCWRADLSATVQDMHCFEALYGGAHVRDRHEVRDNGKTIYAGETIYSGDGSRLVFTYINSLGGVGHGTARADKIKLRFIGHMRASPTDASRPSILSGRSLIPTITRSVRWFLPKAGRPKCRSSSREWGENRRIKWLGGGIGSNREVALPACDVDPLAELESDCSFDS